MTTMTLTFKRNLNFCYANTNMLLRRFSNSLIPVKCYLFQSYHCHLDILFFSCLRNISSLCYIVIIIFFKWNTDLKYCIHNYIQLLLLLSVDNCLNNSRKLVILKYQSDSKSYNIVRSLIR